MSRLYKVDVYHFNVNVGDSELLVVSSAKNATSSKKWSFEKSVFVDGGYGVAWTNRTSNEIKKIANAYEYDVNPKFVFNAVVVTHYDRDHVSGVTRMLENAAEQKDENSPPLAYLYNTRLYDVGIRSGKGKTLFVKYENAIKSLSAKKPTFKGSYVIRQNNNDGSDPSRGPVANVGKELFWAENGSPGYDTVQDLNNLYTLQLPTGSDDVPMLFCLACRNGVIKNSTNPVTVVKPVVPFTSHLQLTPSTPTVTNATSMVLVLVSPKSQTMLQYLGGDSHDKRERSIVNFLYNLGWDGIAAFPQWWSPTSPATKRLLVAKFSHHGSQTSTPIELLDYFRPTVGVLSSGNKTKFMHPSWETLYYLDYWKKSQAGLNMANSPPKQSFQVVTVSHPYWLVTRTTPVIPGFDTTRVTAINTVIKGITNPADTLIVQSYQSNNTPLIPGVYLTTTEMASMSSYIDNAWRGIGTPFDETLIPQSCEVCNVAADSRYISYQKITFGGADTNWNLVNTEYLIQGQPLPKFTTPPTLPTTDPLSLGTSRFGRKRMKTRHFDPSGLTSTSSGCTLSIAGASNPSTNFYVVAMGCALYNFISNLPKRQLILSSTPTTGGTTWSISSLIDQQDLTSQWLNFCNLTSLTITIAGSYINSQVSADAPAVTASATYNIGGTSFIVSGGLTNLDPGYIAVCPTARLNDVALVMMSPSAPSINIITALQAVLSIDDPWVQTLTPFFNINAKIQNPTMLIYNPAAPNSTDLFLCLGPTDNGPIDLLQTPRISIDVSDTMIILNSSIQLTDPNTGGVNQCVCLAGQIALDIETIGVVAGNLVYQGDNSITLSLLLSSPNSLIQMLHGSGAILPGDFPIADPSGKGLLGVTIDLNLSPVGVARTTVFGSINPAVNVLSIGNNLTISGSISFPGPIVAGSITSPISLTQLFAANTSSGGTAPKALTSSSSDSTMVSVMADPVNKTYIIDAEFDNLSITIAGGLAIQEIEISYAYLDGVTEIQLYGTLDLSDPDTPDDGTIALTADYDGSLKHWTLSGYFGQLNMGNIAKLFTGSTPASAATYMSSTNTFLKQIEILELDFSFDIDSGDFSIDAQIFIGPVLFDLAYSSTKTTSGSDDNFHLELSVPGLDQIKITDLLTQILPDEVGQNGLIAQLQQIGLGNLSIPFGSIDIDYDSLHMNLSIAAVSADKTFKIIYTKLNSASTSSVSFVRFVVSSVPNFPIGNIPSPISSLFIYYTGTGNIISADTLKKRSNPNDIDPGSYTALQNVALANQTGPNALNLPTGLSIVLDLGTNTPPEIISLISSSSSLTSASTPTWISVQKSFGPVFIDRIGVPELPTSVSDLKFSLEIDATFKIGPLQVTLNELTLGLTYSSSKGFGLNFGLNGLGLDYSSGDLTIAGTFTENPNPVTPYKQQFNGGIVITVGDYTVTAAGSYALVDDGTHPSYSSFFIFGRLDADLGGPPIAVVNGLAAGFGVGQDLQIPGINNVSDFPLLAGSSGPGSSLGGSSANALDILAALAVSNNPGNNQPWITLNPNGGKWIAVGVDFSSFELVETKLLLTVNFGDKNLTFDLLGRSVCSLPLGAAPDEAFAYVELDIDSHLDPNDGYFIFALNINPNSFVLDRNCHLTGGFATCIWFGDNPHSGDFVTTLGGYHPSYRPPSWYPTVERLGFNWQYNDNISVSGDAYFAVTPACVMGGGGLQFLFQAHDIRAWFTANSDFFMQWHPLYISLSINVSIGASIHLDFLFFSKDVSVEIGASLQIWGPPVSGTVEITYSIFSVTVSFGGGDDPGGPDQYHYITWDEFTLQLPAIPKSSPRLIQMSKITAEDGLIQSGKANVDVDSVWSVRGGQFQFRVDTAVPITKITYNNGTSVNGAPVLNILPIQQAKCQSIHTVSVMPVMSGSTPISGWTPVKVPPPVSMQTPVPDGIIVRNLPFAMWGLPQTNSISADSNQPPIPLWSGLSLRVGEGTTNNNNEVPTVTLNTLNIPEPTFIPAEMLSSTLEADQSYLPISDPKPLQDIASSIVTSSKARSDLVSDFAKLTSLPLGTFVTSNLTNYVANLGAYLPTNPQFIPAS